MPFRVFRYLTTSATDGCHHIYYAQLSDRKKKTCATGLLSLSSVKTGKLSIVKKSKTRGEIMPIRILQCLIAISLITFASTASPESLWDEIKKAAGDAVVEAVNDQTDPETNHPQPQTTPQQQSTNQNSTLEMVKPIILTIDGLDPKLYGKFATWPGATGRDSSYLGDYVYNWDMVEEKDLHYISWDGNIKNTNIAVIRTKNSIEQLYKVAQIDGQPIIIIAHSWGGVIASRALAELRKENRIPTGAIDLLVTMGTPVRNETLLDLGGESPSGSVMKAAANAVKRWTNYHIEEDTYSSDFSYGNRVSTVEASSNYKKIHRSYYQDPRIWNQIERDSQGFLESLSKPVKSNKFTVGDRVETTGNLNIRQTAGGNLVGKQNAGSQGTIVGGPISSGSYIYWKVNYDGAVDGWSVENSLRVYDESKIVNIKPSTPRNSTASTVYCLSGVCLGQRLSEVNLSLNWTYRGNKGKLIGDNSSKMMFGITDAEREYLWRNLNRKDMRKFVGILGKVSVTCVISIRPEQVYLELPDTTVNIDAIPAENGGWQGYQIVGISREYVVPLQRQEEWNRAVENKYPESSGHFSRSVRIQETAGRARLTLKDNRIFGSEAVDYREVRKHPTCQPKNSEEFKFD